MRSLPAEPAGLPLGPDSVTARVVEHPALLLGGPRALLLELAHPLIAAGVAQHSNFARKPMARLARTMRMLDAITFGPRQRSQAAVRSFRSQHTKIKGRAPDGRAYSGNDPELVLWVHATLVDTVLTIDRRYLGLLDDSERERYYEESCLVGRSLGIPERLLPADLGSFGGYMADSIADLSVSDDALRMAELVLHPRVRAPVRPVSGIGSSGLGVFLEAVTYDLLPEALRTAYGLDSLGLALADVGLALASGLTRSLAPRIPSPVLRAISAAAVTMVRLDGPDPVVVAMKPERARATG